MSAQTGDRLFDGTVDEIHAIGLGLSRTNVPLQQHEAQYKEALDMLESLQLHARTAPVSQRTIMSTLLAQKKKDLQVVYERMQKAQLLTSSTGVTRADTKTSLERLHGTSTMIKDMHREISEMEEQGAAILGHMYDDRLKIQGMIKKTAALGDKISTSNSLLRQMK